MRPLALPELAQLVREELATGQYSSEEKVLLAASKRSAGCARESVSANTPRAMRAV